MKLTIESTSSVVTLVANHGGGEIQARMWEGVTEAGVKVICFIPRVAVQNDQDQSQFERELVEMRAPSAEAQSFPLRMII